MALQASKLPLDTAFGTEKESAAWSSIIQSILHVEVANIASTPAVLAADQATVGQVRTRAHQCVMDLAAEVIQFGAEAFFPILYDRLAFFASLLHDQSSDPQRNRALNSLVSKLCSYFRVDAVQRKIVQSALGISKVGSNHSPENMRSLVLSIVTRRLSERLQIRI